MSSIRPALLLAVAAGLLTQAACTQAAPAQDQTDERQVLDIIERTRTTTATYSLYVWNTIIPEGGDPLEEWAAEFHSGHKHRVETPAFRLVANCEDGTGISLEIATGVMSSGPEVARTACGISTSVDFTGWRFLGRVQTPHGPAERVQVTDATYEREYDVSPDGVLVATTYRMAGGDGSDVLRAEAVDILPTLPGEDMFSEASLQKSFVSARYRSAPDR